MSDPKSKKNDVIASLDQIHLSLQGKTILHDVSLELQAGKILTVIGPNGAGKSSLIQVLLGFEKPDSGKVFRKAKLRIGYVPQKINLNTIMPITVERFVALAGKRRSNALAALEETGVASLAKQSLQKLSGGEFQRVLLARALQHKPQLLILDEPAQGVDVIGQAELYEKIAALKDKYGFSVLLVSHDLHLVMQKTDQVLCLNQHICCSGQADAVSQHPEYQRLFGNLPTQGLAVYTHNHNHCHDLHGDVVTGECQHPEHNHKTLELSNDSGDQSLAKEVKHEHG